VALLVSAVGKRPWRSPVVGADARAREISDARRQVCCRPLEVGRGDVERSVSSGDPQPAVRWRSGEHGRLRARMRRVLLAAGARGSLAGLLGGALNMATRPSIGMRTVRWLRRWRCGSLAGTARCGSSPIHQASAERVHGVIYPPRVALIGFGAIRDRPWAQDGMIGARPIVRASLAADHRASDGHAGGRLLASIDRQLQNPEAL
jgi:hypothetical protein